MSKDRLIYPKQIVHENGAKAGLLMHVARHAPDIPQLPFVVSTIGERVESILSRADQSGIGWPRLFRSSAVAELHGYEGEFPTKLVRSFEDGHAEVAWNSNNHGMYRNQDYFDRELRNLYNQIRGSSVAMRYYRGDPSLPDEINVIVVQESPSKYVGTYVKHPNREDYYVGAITDARTISPEGKVWGDNPQRSNFDYTSAAGVDHMQDFSRENVDLTNKVKKDLETVVSWHDRIVGLPDMDQDWTYQIEFGVDPPLLYQVRPFKAKQLAGHQVEAPTRPDKTLVIGVTDEEGLVLKVHAREGIKDPHEVQNKEGHPALYSGELRGSWYSDRLLNMQAAVLGSASGLLAHNDVRIIRRSQVTVLFAGYTPWDLPLKDGEKVKVISDGKNVKFEAN